MLGEIVFGQALTWLMERWWGRVLIYAAAAAGAAFLVWLVARPFVAPDR